MHVCLFDIDGTLISSGGAGKAALEAALLAEFGIERLADEISLSGRTDRAILADLVRIHRLDSSPETVERLTIAYLYHLPASLAAGRGTVLPGIAHLLDELRTREDVLLGLLTGNIRAGARAKLSHFGLWDYFALGGFGDLHLDRDDVARDAWREVYSHCNGSVRVEDVWVIGDTPLDVRCARAIGARVVAVATGWHSLDELAEHRPDLLLRDLADAGPLLAFLPR